MKLKIISRQLISLIIVAVFFIQSEFLFSDMSLCVYAENNEANEDYSKSISFENNDDIVKWSAEGGGAREISAKHYKHGSKSLMWNWENGSRLEAKDIRYLKDSNLKGGGMKIWIYSETPIDDEVTFNFGKQDEINQSDKSKQSKFVYSFKARLNFKGWRALWVMYRQEGDNPLYYADLDKNDPEYEEKKFKRQSTPLDIMQIIPPASQVTGKIYIDLVEFLPKMILARTADYQMPKEGINVGEGTWDKLYYHSKLQPSIPLEKEITCDQINAFKVITERYEKWIMGDSIDYKNLKEGPLKIRYNALQTFISEGLKAYEGLNIQRYPDKSITGIPLFSRSDLHLPKFGEAVSKRVLLPLVYDYKINGNKSSVQKIINTLDYMNDQGWSFGSSLGTQNHETNINNGYFHTVFIMRDELKKAGILDRELKTCFWYGNFGKTFDNTYTETTSDELRTKAMYNLLYVLAMEDTPKKVQYMKGLLRWYNEALQFAPGYADIIKPDYSLFHHRGTYPGGYGSSALHMGSLLAYMLHGTDFSISNQSYDNLKNSLLYLERISNKYDFSYGVMGRLIKDTRKIAEVLPAYAYLALAKDPVDQDMASSFMRFWNPQLDYLKEYLFVKADSYSVEYINTLGGLQLAENLAKRNIAPKEAPQGIWVQPYSALAVNRYGDWMASIKGWSQYVFDYEAANHINPKTLQQLNENVYGRYIGYGSIQLVKPGLTEGFKESGLNINEGWDWNRWPGITARHLPWKELFYTPETPSRNFTDETFVGGVTIANNKYGMFSMKLHDNVFDKTFRANKSIFFFGDKMICLGSNIVSKDKDHSIETTLFQSFMPTSGMPFWCNSIQPIINPIFTYSGQKNNKVWMVDPYGNGYVVPNSKDLRIVRGEQKSRSESDQCPNPDPSKPDEVEKSKQFETSGYYTTAYLDHGVAPGTAAGSLEGKGYEYAIKIGAGAEGTAAFKDNMQYEVLKRDNEAHIVKNTQPDLNIMGYAVFNSNCDIKHGMIKKTSAPAMFMTKKVNEHEAVLSMSEPDLRLSKSKTVDFNEKLLLKPSEMQKVIVTLRGKWNLKNTYSDVRVLEKVKDATILEFDCIDGKTIEVGLVNE